jgi:prepilin signal peptidase PulO-like enzyme (type II secretory pathway)
MNVETCFGVAFLVGLAVGIVLVIYGTIAKNGWGVNLRRVECPSCGVVMGPVRMPNSREQALWGGYTCAACKCEIDKWGRQISRPV